MKLKLLFIVILFSSFCFSQIDRTKTYTQTVNLNPGEKNGFLGTVTMVYAFANCFGDAIMAYGYKDLKITKVKYNGKTYTAKDLGIPNFNKYKMSLHRIEANFNFSYAHVTSKVLTYVLDKYDLGCFGETVTIASKNAKYNKNIDAFSVSFKNAQYGMSLLLSSKIEAYEKKKIDTKTYTNLLFKAGNTDNLEDKIKLIKKALKLAPNAREKTITKIYLSNTEKELEKKKKEAKEKLEKQNKSNSKSLVLKSTSTKKTTSKIASVKSNKNTSYNYTPSASNYNVTQTMYRNNTLYQQKFSAIDKAGEQLKSLIGSIIDQKRKRREAKERAIAQREQRIKDEKRRKENFYRQADRYINEIKDIVKNRKEYFIEKQNKPTYHLDGSSFEPIYISYAYTKKGYDGYSSHARYPSTMNIKLYKPEAVVYFSPVMAVFPFSNGTYPYFEDIKNNILNNYLPIDPLQYDITFLDAETSVDKMIQSLTQNMNKVVYNHEFTSAIPSKNNNIIFLNDKIVDSNNTDYWTGGVIENKEFKKVNYFKSNTSTKKENVNYFKLNTLKTPKKKVNYWEDTTKKTDTTKINH